MSIFNLFWLLFGGRIFKKGLQLAFKLADIKQLFFLDTYIVTYDYFVTKKGLSSSSVDTKVFRLEFLNVHIFSYFSHSSIVRE